LELFIFQKPHFLHSEFLFLSLKSLSSKLGFLFVNFKSWIYTWNIIFNLKYILSLLGNPNIRIYKRRVISTYLFPNNRIFLRDFLHSLQFWIKRLHVINNLNDGFRCSKWQINLPFFFLRIIFGIFCRIWPPFFLLFSFSWVSLLFVPQQYSCLSF